MQMPDINKKMESALIPMELAARLRKASGIIGVAKSDIICLALLHYLATIELEPEDYQWMKEEVEKNRDRRKNSASLSPNNRINAKLSKEEAAKRPALKGHRLTEEKRMEILRRLAELGGNQVESEQSEQGQEAQS